MTREVGQQHSMCRGRVLRTCVEFGWSRRSERTGHTLLTSVNSLPSDGSSYEPKIHTLKHLGGLGTNAVLLWDKCVLCHSNTYCE